MEISSLPFDGIVRLLNLIFLLVLRFSFTRVHLSSPLSPFSEISMRVCRKNLFNIYTISSLWFVSATCPNEKTKEIWRKSFLRSFLNWNHAILVPWANKLNNRAQRKEIASDSMRFLGFQIFHRRYKKKRISLAGVITKVTSFEMPFNRPISRTMKKEIAFHPMLERFVIPLRLAPAAKSQTKTKIDGLKHSQCHLKRTYLLRILLCREKLWRTSDSLMKRNFSEANGIKRRLQTTEMWRLKFDKKLCHLSLSSFRHHFNFYQCKCALWACVK